MNDGPEPILGNSIQLTRISDVVSRHDPDAPWFEVIISDGRNRVMIISGPPGTPPDPHIHADYNEWWIAVGGTTRWQIGQYEPLLATFGDVVMAPAGYSHDIRPKGVGAALRLAVSHPNSNHDIRGVAPAREVPVEYALSPPNLIHTKPGLLGRERGADAAWSQVVVKDNRNIATLIQDVPGDTSPDERDVASDEWWLMLEGTATVYVGEEAVLDVASGDIVLVEAGTRYRLDTTGDTPSRRIQVTAP